MKAQFLLVTVVFFSFSSFGQIGSNDCRKSTPVFELAEKMPEPAGGMDSLKIFFQKELISWGLDNQTHKLDIDLLIDNAGSACPYMIYLAPYTLPTDKITNSIKTMSTWKPAMQNGHKVDCYVKLSLQIEAGVLTKLIYKNSKNR